MPIFFAAFLGALIGSIIANGGLKRLLIILTWILGVICVLFALLMWGMGFALEKGKAEQQKLEKSFSDEEMTTAKAAATDYLNECMDTSAPVTCDGAAHTFFGGIDESIWHLRPTTWSNPSIGDGDIAEVGESVQITFPATLHSSVLSLPRNAWEPEATEPQEWDDEFSITVTMDGGQVSDVSSAD